MRPTLGQELDKYCTAGTVVTVLASVPLADRTRLLEEGKQRKLELKRVELCHELGSPQQRKHLERVLTERPYASALVLAEEEADISASDSRALTTLLLVRDILRVMAAEAAAAGGPPPVEMTLLGEILDSETRDLVAAAGVSDYIMSNQLLSKMFAMVAENAATGPLLAVLFSEEGDELHVRDARAYAAEGETLSFWEMAARARARGDCAVGHKRGGARVELNPPDKQRRVRWGRGDFLVVIGDDAGET